MTAAAGPGPQRTPARRKARQLAKYLRAERPDYAYLKDVFRYLRQELDIEVTRAPKKLPYVPTEAEIRAFYDAVWKARRASDVILIKTLLYTGVRVSEIVRIRIADVDLDTCRIRITQGKGGKDRVVPFPAAFKETLALHIDAQRRAGAVFLFESSWKKPYSDRGVRKILARYTQAAGITASISPHTLRHFLFTWLKGRGVASDATFRSWREGGVAGPAALPGVGRACGRAAGHAVDQGFLAAGCVRRQDVASESVALDDRWLHLASRVEGAVWGQCGGRWRWWLPMARCRFRPVPRCWRRCWPGGVVSSRRAG